MSVFGIAFGQPWVLLGLLALPLIWLFLRASPSPPRERALPSMSLIADIDQREQSPERTPWWLAALRLLLAALVLVALAEPRRVRSVTPEAEGPLLLVVDDGWPSAVRWDDTIRAARAVVAEARAERRAVAILRTAPRSVAADELELLDAGEAERRLRALRPTAWLPDRAVAAERVANLAPRVARVVWICDGLYSGDGAGEWSLSTALARLAPVQVQRFLPRGAYAVGGARGQIISVLRAAGGEQSSASLVARNRSGLSLGLAGAEFATGKTAAEARFALPTPVLNRTTRFELSGVRSAGAVWLREHADIRPRVGIDAAGGSGLPLSDTTYFVTRALEPHAELIPGTLADLIGEKPDAIIVADRRIEAGDPIAASLQAWIEAGGVLIRFAGPLLASGTDAFVPTRLRPASRSLGGALAWDTPRKPLPPPPESPLFGIPEMPDSFVRQQVLAEPGPGLEKLVWASLEDNTPIVTARAVGDGRIVLFHVTATPDWSDIPYTGGFVEMLRRSALSGTFLRRRAEPGGYLTPLRVLDGFGTLTAPAGDLAPVAADGFDDLEPGPRTPPGLYDGPSGTRALNAGRTALEPLTRFPAEVEIIDGPSDVGIQDWRGPLLSLALILFVVDVFASLALAGLLPFVGGRRHAARSAAMLLALAATLPRPAAEAAVGRDVEAALELRLAFVETGSPAQDRIMRAGLDGLGRVLRYRTAVELAPPHAVRPGRDPLELYPLIYFSPTPETRPLDAAAVSALNAYIRRGGALFIDTRDTAPGHEGRQRLAAQLAGLDIPPLVQVPENHVLFRSFYLLGKNHGRLEGGHLWIESAPAGTYARGDGVAGLFVGGADWIGAWALDESGRALLPMDAGEARREYALRFGVNLVMYVLTGNYKEDQVHLPELLRRLERREEEP